MRPEPLNKYKKSGYIHYCNPNTDLSTIRSFLSLGQSQKYIESYFQKYCQKKYVLITFSGRSALYLAYKALNITGKVITSPLTCLTAILPIIHAGNKPVFLDIDANTLTMDPNNLSISTSPETVAIQPIHFGGIPCDMDSISQFARDNRLYLIEDCAQGFGAKVGGLNVGTFGDISVFSLAKNLYGLFGGVFATDNKEFYDKAKKIQNSFPKSSSAFLGYRYLRNFLKSSGKSFSDKLYFFLMKLKQEIRRKDQNDYYMASLMDYLKKPSNKASAFSEYQLKRINSLHRIRAKKAKMLMDVLKDIKRIHIPQLTANLKSSFVKLYIYSCKFGPDVVLWMNKNGIEAKHLEEEYNVFYQKRFDIHELFKDNQSLNRCTNYIRIHDKLVSIPIHERMTDKDFYFVKERIRSYLDL